MFRQKGNHMRISKRRVTYNALISLGVAVVCYLIHADLFANSFLIVGLFFVAWLLWKVYRDHRLSQPARTYAIRSARADYQREPELMSRGSRGLPTSFD